MIIGLAITILSAYDMHSSGFSWSLVGCILLGIYLMMHQHNT